MDTTYIDINSVIQNNHVYIRNNVMLIVQQDQQGPPALVSSVVFPIFFGLTFTLSIALSGLLLSSCGTCCPRSRGETLEYRVTSARPALVPALECIAN